MLYALAVAAVLAVVASPLVLLVVLMRRRSLAVRLECRPHSTTRTRSGMAATRGQQARLGTAARKTLLSPQSILREDNARIAFGSHSSRKAGHRGTQMRGSYHAINGWMEEVVLAAPSH